MEEFESDPSSSLHSAAVFSDRDIYRENENGNELDIPGSAFATGEVSAMAINGNDLQTSECAFTIFLHTE